MNTFLGIGILTPPHRSTPLGESALPCDLQGSLVVGRTDRRDIAIFLSADICGFAATLGAKTRAIW